MSPSGFEPAFPESQRSQTHAQARAATGTGKVLISIIFLKQSASDTCNSEVRYQLAMYVRWP